MTTLEINFRIALEIVSFDFFKQCIKNGASPEQAKNEMMTKQAQEIILGRIKEIN